MTQQPMMTKFLVACVIVLSATTRTIVSVNAEFGAGACITSNGMWENTLEDFEANIESRFKSSQLLQSSETSAVVSSAIQKGHDINMYKCTYTMSTSNGSTMKLETVRFCDAISKTCAVAAELDGSLCSSAETCSSNDSSLTVDCSGMVSNYPTCGINCGTSNCPYTTVTDSAVATPDVPTSTTTTSDASSSTSTKTETEGDAETTATDTAATDADAEKTATDTAATDADAETTATDTAATDADAETTATDTAATDTTAEATQVQAEAAQVQAASAAHLLSPKLLLPLVFFAALALF